MPDVRRRGDQAPEFKHVDDMQWEMGRFKNRILLRWHDLRPRNICLHARPALRTRDDDEERRYGCFSPISGSNDRSASGL